MSADRDPAVDAWDAALNDSRARLNAANPTHPRPEHESNEESPHV